MMFMTPEEIQALTGKKFRSSQAHALRLMGIEHKVRPDGSVAVLKSHVEEVFSGKKPTEAKSDYGLYAMPDFSKVA